jgi:TonB family protein
MVRENYIGTIPLQEQEEPGVVVLADAPPVRFSNYAAPIYPRLAEMARIQGDVRLRITMDVQTGSVNDVQAVSGHPLLQRAALDAARHWQFQQDAQMPESFESTVRFGLRCPSQLLPQSAPE